ncbi:MAG: hypothetical protein ACREHC_01585 [Candidatus Levyibacteriota bacterium]
MRKPIHDPLHVKNRILVVIYVFRSLPAYYFEDIQVSTKEKNSIKYIINNLMQGGFIKKKPSLRKRIQFLLLTKKGHKFVATHIFQNKEKQFYLYRTDRLARFTDSDHRFMNFVYLWEWIAKNTALLNTGLKIFEDSNRNYCKLNFAFGSDSVVLYPDVLILLPDATRGSEFFKALIVENDTGLETSGTLFRKIVEYSAYAIKGRKQGFISEAELIFTLHSKERSKRLLPNLVPHAKNYNSTQKVKDVRAVHLLEAFGEEGIKLQFSVLDTVEKTKHDLYTTLSYDFRKELLKKNPSWQYLL